MDWNARYEAGDTPWEKGAPAPPLLEWLERRATGMDGHVLVPGCGLGHDVRALAAAEPAARIVGLDLAADALRRAREFSKIGNEAYLSGDFLALPQALQGRYDWIFEHTCFCAIDPKQRENYVSAAAAALHSDGRLLAIFYLNPWDAGEALPPGGGPPFGVAVAELDALFAHEFRLLEEHRPTRAYPGREGRELMRLYQKIPTSPQMPASDADFRI